MQKLFRFQYEACNGTCYGNGDRFFQDLKDVPKAELTQLINKIVDAHNRMCNNPNMRFGLDFDQTNKIYIGNWMNNGTLDLFTSTNFMDVVTQLTSHVLKVVPVSQSEYENNCEFGEGHENLAEQILNAIPA